MTAKEYEKILQQTGKRKKGEIGTYELEIIRPGGKAITMLVTATPQYDSSNQYMGAFGVFRDITNRKKNEEQLRYLSMHDGLTGVFNRGFFDTEMERIRKSRSYPVSIFVMDIDELKKVNDKLGHPAGDQLLKRAAELISSCFRADDIVARIGGDEFAVILPGTNEEVAADLAARTRLMLERYNSKDQVEPVHFSYGYATGHKGSDLNQIFKIADAKMFNEKAEKKRAASIQEGSE